MQLRDEDSENVKRSLATYHSYFFSIQAIFVAVFWKVIKVEKARMVIFGARYILSARLYEGPI